jgi:hypothetical protein
MGANKLLRSMNQGESFDVISDDLTTGGKKGNVPYGTLTTISESPFQFGLIYTGSDDGYINMTSNSGDTWTRVSNSLPQGLWVSRVIASQHNKARVYATLNGYRNDDFKAYVFMSDDFGKTWKDISSNLPDTAPVNVIKEDTANENLVYLGTDNGVYASFNNGDKWEAFANGLNTVAVHDLVVHPEAKDLLVGTHGRSIYKSDISALQKHNLIGNKAITIFDTEAIQSSRRWGSSWGQFYPAFEPETTIKFYSNAKAKLGMNILSEGGTLLKAVPVNADAGYNYVAYDLTISDDGKKALQKENSKLRISQAQNGKIYLPKGTYTIQIGSQKTTLEVK